MTASARHYRAAINVPAANLAQIVTLNGLVPGHTAC